MTKTYRVVLLGRMEEKQDFEEKMEKLGFSPGSVRDLIEKAPSALKAGSAAWGSKRICGGGPGSGRQGEHSGRRRL